MAFNIPNVLNLLLQEFSNEAFYSEITQNEKFVASELSVILWSMKEKIDNNEKPFEVIEELAFGDKNESDYVEEKPKNDDDNIPFEYRKKVVDYWHGPQGEKRKFSSVQHSYKKIKRFERH